LFPSQEIEPMDERKDEKKSPPEETEQEAEKSRKALDSIPPPGTDPLHEGP
jgi:hypothetical protein